MTIEQRLGQLERQNRRFKAVGIAAGMIWLAVAIMGAAKPIPDVVKARAFHVIGENGTALVKLDAILTNDQVGNISTMNARGKVLFGVGSTRGGGGAVATMNAAGKELVVIGMTTDGVGLVRAYDPSGRHGFGQLTPRH